MTLTKISGPFNLLQSSDVARLKVQIRDQRRQGVHVETRPSTRYKIGVDLYRSSDGMTTAKQIRAEQWREVAGASSVASQRNWRAK